VAIQSMANPTASWIGRTRADRGSDQADPDERPTVQFGTDLFEMIQV
jgi:hypothetical protein